MLEVTNVIHLTNHIFTSDQTSRLFAYADNITWWLAFLSIFAGALGVIAAILVAYSIYKLFESKNERDSFKKQIEIAAEKRIEKFEEDISKKVEKAIETFLTSIDNKTYFKNSNSNIKKEEVTEIIGENEDENNKK